MEPHKFTPAEAEAIIAAAIPGWWTAVAREKLAEGRWRIFPGRLGNVPYLLRIFLSPPRHGDPDLFNIDHAIVLHFFVQGDDDGALHDHPGDFESYILAGGYREEMPASDWAGGSSGITLNDPQWRHTNFPTSPAPRLGPVHTVCYERIAGDTLFRPADQLHSVVALIPGTVTMVHMGAKYRPWGFHPAGRPWIEAHRYLDECRNRPEASFAGVVKS